ncbi:hypothetical protein K469DRAFT_690362 [Zopfia rhizophila CBS 207.26]|uniref:Uncharacterized protein n=1 Tax=Zopfia rhizophila CBS 207.26 TaxID=1314779 RepID=A0A6A6D5U9_9PEZI|nr:hypothetical protein K469DRAFT_690362 [Zopfia rhizophila CBS 207.26]
MLRFDQVPPKLPGLVIEVAWSQRKLDLKELANVYIRRSRGLIRTVFGVNLNDIYAAMMRQHQQGIKATLGKAAATFSVWRAEVDKSNGSKGATAIPSVLDEVFRDEDGNPVTGADLQLSLKDFICEEIANSFEDIEDPEIVLSSESLCRHYERALKLYLKVEAQEETQHAPLEVSDIKRERKHKGFAETIGLRRSQRNVNPRRSERLEAKLRAS